MRTVSHILAPAAAYLLTGLVVIKCSGILENSMYFAVWGIAAAVIMVIKECIVHRAVTIGISVYAAVAVLWFGLIADDAYRIHAVLAVTGLLGMMSFHALYRFRLVSVMTGYVMMTTLVCLELMDCHFSRVTIALAVFLLLTSVSETIAMFERYSTETFVLLYGLTAAITVFTPAPQEPYDWGFVVRAVQAANSMAEHLVTEMRYRWGQDESGGMFSYGYTGYSDSPALLTAGVKSQDTQQLLLYGIRTRRDLYLKGKTSEFFTGVRWESTLEEPTLDYRIDTLQTLYAIFGYTQDIDVLHRFVNVCEQKVTFSYIRTQSQFYPLKLLGTTALDIQFAGDNPVSGQTQGKGYSYSYEFVDLDYASAEMEAVIEGSKNSTYEEEQYDLIYEKLQEYYGVQLEKIPFDDFLKQTAGGMEQVRSCYGTVDSVVSERIRALAGELTKNCESDYEKCRVLERYLYQYAYNQDTVVPEDANMLNWFLFEGRQGYCVHYATALVQMLRCVGIPARVAEGFLVDYRDSTRSNEYSVAGSAAHAWAEAYIEGFGWMRLEPTVVYAPNANAAWYAAAETERAQPDTAQESVLSGEEVSKQVTTESDADIMAESQKDWTFWIMMVVLFGGMAVVILLILLALWIYRRHVFRKTKNPDVIFRRLLSLLEKKLLPRENSETVREYFGRLLDTEQIPETEKSSFLQLADWMERYWYAGIVPDDNEVLVIKKMCDQFL